MPDPDEKTNVTTVSWNAETVAEFETAYRKAGFRSRAHFFDLAGLALIKQTKAGEKIIFPPLRLETAKPLPPKKPKQKRPIRKKKT